VEGLVNQPYHSALEEPGHPAVRNIHEEVRRVTNSKVTAILHDLIGTQRLPAEFDACDLIYSEPAFSQRDIAVFLERVGKTATGHEHQQMLYPLGVAARERPVVLIGGREIKSHMPSPTYEQPIRVDGPGKDGKGINAKVLAWNVESPTLDLLPFIGNTTNLLRALAEGYDCVGDPCCGFGNTGLKFVQAGKRAVLSDHDPACLRYVADHMKLWEFGLV
jgi:hypothetical protein